MQEGPIAALLVEDDEDEVLLMREAIRDSGASDITLDHAATLKTALAKLASGTYDAVLLDLSLPDSSGIEGVSAVVKSAGEAPVIVCTGLNDEATGKDAIRDGAQDYLVKNPQLYGALPRILRYAVERSRLIFQANRKLEQARTYTELLLTKVISIANAGLGIVNGDGIFIIVNPALEDLAGRAAAELVGKPWTDLLVKEDRAAELRAFKTAFSGDEYYDRERLNIQRKDGRAVAVPMRSVLVDFEEDRLCRVLSFGIPSESGAGTGSAPAGGQSKTAPELRVSASATQVAAARIQLAGLETVKAEAGQYWTVIAPRVFATAEETIAGHLSSGDSYARTRDDDFIVCFDRLDWKEASSKAQLIGKDMRERLRALQYDGQFSGLGLDPGLWQDMAETSAETHLLKVSPGEVQRAPDATEFVSKRIDEAVARSGAEIKGKVEKLQETCSSRLREAVKRQKSGVSLMMHDFDPETRMQVKQLIGLDEDNARIVAEIDCIALRRAARHIAALKAKQAPLVAVDVHFSTLVDRSLFGQYAAACNELDKRATQSLVFNIKGVPRHIRKSRLAAAVNILGPFSQLTMVELDRPDLGSIDLRGASIPLVTIAYDKMLGTYYRNRSKCVDLVKKVHRAGARVVVDRVTSRDGSYLFRDLGVDFISYEPKRVRGS